MASGGSGSDEDAETLRRKQPVGAPTDRRVPAAPSRPPPAPVAQDASTPGAPPTVKGIPQRSGDTLQLKGGAPASWTPPEVPEATHEAPPRGPKAAADPAPEGTLDMAPPGFATAAVRHVAEGGDTFGRASLTPEEPSAGGVGEGSPLPGQEQARADRGGTLNALLVPDEAMTVRGGGVGGESGGMAFAVTQPRSRAGPVGIPPTGGAAGAGKGGLPKPGERLGKYEIVRELARGGMGVVYLAKDVALKRSVALKVMLDAADDSDRRRFLREAESAGRLQHPNICAVYDSGEDGAGRCYFTMEFIDGAALNKYVRAGHLDVRQILELYLKVCDGVGYAHMHGVIHRDLKPPNIFVDARGEPKVMDFGIAKQLGAAEIEQSQITVHGSVMGTPSYMSPEQASGQASEIDIRSDVYTLGVILYELLCEQLPFKGATVTAILLAVCGAEAPLPRTLRQDLDWEVEAIVLKSMQKKKEDRYQSAFELKEDLEAYLGGRPIGARKAGWAYKLKKLVQRNRGASAGAAVALAALLGVAGWRAAEWRARAEKDHGDVVELLRIAADQYGKAKSIVDDPSKDPAAAREFAFTANDRAKAARAREGANEAAEALVTSTTALMVVVEERATTYARDEEARLRRERDAADARSEVAEARRALAALSLDAATTTALADERAAALKAIEVQLLGARLKDASVEASKELDALLAKQRELGEKRARLDRQAEMEAHLAGAARELERGRAAAAAAEGARAAGAPRETEEAHAAEADARLRAAIAAAGQALERDPSDARSRAARIEAGAEYARFCIARRKLELAAFAVDGFEKLEAKEAPLAPDLRRRIVEAGVNVAKLTEELDLGERALGDGKSDEAAVHFGRARTYDASSRAAAFGLAVVGARDRAKDDPAAAVAALEAAAASAPEVRFQDLARREAASTKKGAVEAAVARAKECLRTADSAGALRALAKVLPFAKEHEEVAELAARARGQSGAEAGFVFVPAGPYPFGPLPDAKDVAVAAFYAGRTEVTNAEFAEFVRGGGYARDEWWPDLPEDRRAGLVDSVGAPGPSEWANGQYDAKLDRRPVTGICFYEARAYALSKGARLLTELEWEKAACWDAASRKKSALPGPWEQVHALFELEAPYDVETRAEDRSASGIRDAYGSVQEWCAGAEKGGKPAWRGGFYSAQTPERASAVESRRRDPWVRAPLVGFRLGRDAR